MLKILYELCLSKEMACIYTNYNDTSKFHFGTIIAVNEEEIAIQTISPDGENDGIVVIGTDYINRVETNSQYIEKMKKLCAGDSLFLNDLEIDNNNIINSILLFAFKEKEVVSIELIDSGYNDVIGIIEEIDDIECKIKQFNEYGYVDGELYFRVNDITKVAVLTQDEKRIMRLKKINYQGNTEGKTEQSGDGSLIDKPNSTTS